MIFELNDIYWEMKYAPSNSSVLIDRTGELKLACTDPITKCIYISDKLSGELKAKVVKHELCHCVLLSYGLLNDIHRMTKPENRIEMEEYICNIVSDYSSIINTISEMLMNYYKH